MSPFAGVDLVTNGWISFVLKEKHQLVLSNDPPLIYYLFSSWYTLLDPIFPKSVFSDVFQNMATTPVQLSQVFRITQPAIYIFSFVSMVPYLIFDLMLALLFLRLFEDENKSLYSFKLWMINPVILFISYIQGQYDIIAVFFFVLGLYYFKRQKTSYGMLSIGLSGAFKLFAFFFVPFLLYVYSKGDRPFLKRARRIIFMLILSVLPFTLSFLATYLIPSYYQSVNAAAPKDFAFNGYFGRTLYYRGEPKQPLFVRTVFFFIDSSASLRTLSGFIDVIYLTPLVYGLFLLWVFYQKEWSFDKMWKAMLVFLLLYYAIALFLWQWFLWAQPLLILLIAEDRKKFLKLYVLLIPLFFIYSGYWNPDFVGGMNAIGLPSYQVINLFRSFLSAVCIFIVYLMFKPNSIPKADKSYT